MTNVELVTKAYADFALGNLESVLALWDSRIEWHESKGMPFLTGDGIYIGREAVVTEVLMKLPVYFEGFKIEVKQIFGADDKVVMMGYYCGKNKATGKTFRANAVHVWTAINGKITHCFQGVDTKTINS